MRALFVGLLASFVVTQAAAAAMQGHTPVTPENKVERATTLDEQLERKVAVLRKYRGTIRFFHTHRTLLSSTGRRAAAKSAVASAERRVRQLTATIAALQAKIRKREARQLQTLPPRAAICSVFGSYCDEAVAVARCESRLRTTAHNGQYLGLFQMGSYERELFGHGDSAVDQATAAHRYFVRSGRDWSPWSCRWAAA